MSIKVTVEVLGELALMRTVAKRVSQSIDELKSIVSEMEEKSKAIETYVSDSADYLTKLNFRQAEISLDAVISLARELNELVHRAQDILSEMLPDIAYLPDGAEAVESELRR